jgi:negative regulator of genetic competence, sporulation and motility
MKIRRINENTISCIITPEDLRENGFRIDDFFDRKKEAVDLIRQAVVKAARSENFKLEGELTTMRISILPDHSLSLLITREDSREGALQEVRRIAKSIFESMAEKAAQEQEDTDSTEADQNPSESLMKALLSGDGEETADSGSGEEQVRVIFLDPETPLGERIR